MKFLSDLTKFTTNIILVLLFFGIVLISALSLYSLSPRSYESIQEKNKVLGIYEEKKSDTADLLFKDINRKSTDYKVLSFRGESGYIAKINLRNTNIDKNLNIVKIINNSHKDQRYKVSFRVAQEIDNKLNFVLFKDDEYYDIKFDDGGNFNKSFILKKENSSQLGIGLDMKENFYDFIGVELEIIKI